MRRASVVLLCWVIGCVFISGCTQKPAGIEEKGGEYYGRTSYYPAPLIKKNLKTTATKVQKGDTLYSISRKHHVSMRNLIDVNSLKAPYVLAVGARLIVPSTHMHKVKYRETLFQISREYNLAINQLVRANNIKKPYKIYEEQLLVIPIGYRLIEKPEIRAPKMARASIPSSHAKKIRKKHASAKKPKSRPRKVKAMSHSKKQTKVSSNTGFIWPLRGRVISQFGPKKGGLYNDGINIAAKEGQPIKAVADGTVVYNGSELKGYGNLVIIKHPNGYITAYAHNKAITVKKGQHVKSGQVIANVGKTGHVTSPQLHFAIRKGRKAVNPKKYLKHLG